MDSIASKKPLPSVQQECASQPRRRFTQAALALMAGAAAPAGFAQAAYPSRPIRVIVPFGAGTGLDVVARGFSIELSKQLGVSVVVENREGAGGTIGCQAVQEAAPDGYTLLFNANPPFAVQPMLQAKPGYDPTRFTPVAKLASVAMALTTSGRSRFKTFAEAIEFAERNPGKLTYAHAGTGTLSFLAMERMKKERNLNIVEVAYKSTTQSMMDTISGVVDFQLPSLAQAMPLATTGELRLLALGYPNRSPALPDVPTLSEGLKQPGFEAVVWYGVFGPQGMNPDHVRRLNAELQKAMATPAMGEILSRAKVDITHSSADELAALVKNEVTVYRKLLADVGVKPQ